MKNVRLNVFLSVATLIVAMNLSPAAPAFADEYHYVNTFVGDRAAGLAGAYTAIADGPEGMYYNPAGIAFAPGNYFSISTNAFEFREWVFKDLVSSGVDFTRRSFTLVPNFFGFIQRAGRTVWGFTIVSPDARSIELRDDYDFILEAGTFNNESSGPLTNLANEDVTQTKYVRQNTDEQVFEIGPSFGRLVGDRLGLGVTALIGYSVNETTLNETNILLTENNVFVAQIDQTNMTKKESIWLRPVLGFQYLLTDDVSVGLATTARVTMYRSSDSYTVATTVSNLSSQSPVSSFTEPYRTSESSDLLNEGVIGFLPIEQRLGVAWFASPQLLLSGDVRLYVPINSDDLTGTEDERPFSWNAAVGAEYFLTPNFPLRLGVFTNNANTDTVDVGQTNQPEHVDLYGGTATLGFATSDLMLNLGAAFSYGSGKGQIIGGGSGSEDVQTLNRWSGAIFISGGYRF